MLISFNFCPLAHLKKSCRHLQKEHATCDPVLSTAVLTPIIMSKTKCLLTKILPECPKLFLSSTFCRAITVKAVRAGQLAHPSNLFAHSERTKICSRVRAALEQFLPPPSPSPLRITFTASLERKTQHKKH